MLKLLNRTFGHTAGLPAAINESVKQYYMNDSKPSQWEFTKTINNTINQHGVRDTASPTSSKAQSTYTLSTKEEILKRFVCVHSLFPATTTVPDGMYTLVDILEQCSVGRFSEAINKVMEHWTLSDSLEIMKHGVLVYHQQRVNPDMVQKCLSTSVASLVHNHIIERMTAKTNEVQKQETVREKRIDKALLHHLIRTVEC
jgi:hypothetical protein